MKKLSKITVLFCLLCLYSFSQVSDPSFATNKVMCGYQGWFKCDGDGGSTSRWIHWSKNPFNIPNGNNLAVDMYPDLRELDNDELYDTAMTIGGGASTAKLFSSRNPKTVNRHFKWMQDYGIDGVYLQRFVEIFEGSDTDWKGHLDQVVNNVKAGAEANGRVFAIMYDISGASTGFWTTMQADWQNMVDSGVTSSPSYLHHEGKPVIGIWGFGFVDGVHPPVNPAEAQNILDYFHGTAPAQYQATVFGGVPGRWRTLSGDSRTDPAWAAVYRSFDFISPWTVGRYSTEANADNWATTRIVPDIADCNSNGIDYVPVVWPGFSWSNLHAGESNSIPRNGGNFFWNQAYNAVSSGAKNIYIAMFDEVDEGTAIFKIAETSADTPDQGFWLPLDADGYSLPSDWYLKLACGTGRMLRGELTPTQTIPAVPCLTGVACGAGADIENGLQGHWDLDEGTGGTIYDNSANNYTGTVGGASWAAGTNGGALDFDAPGAATVIGGVNIAGTEISLAGWVRHDTLPGSVQSYFRFANEALVIRHDGASSAGQLHTYMRMADATYYHIRADGVLTTGDWYHVAATWDGSSLKLYMNGSLLGIQNSPSTLVTGSQDLFVSLAGEDMDGRIDDIRLYDRALSSCDIYGLYTGNTNDNVAPVIQTLSPPDNSGTAPFASDLVITFNENVSAGAGAVRIYSNGGLLAETISAASLVYSNNTVTISPAGNLRMLASYYVEIDPNAFVDGPGNYFAGISGTTGWNFMTDGDLSGPLPGVLTAPANGATVTTASATLTWNTFSDASGILHYIIDVNGQLFTNTAASLLYTFPADGLYSWRVRGVDIYSNTGNWSPAYTVTKTTLVDSTSPPVPGSLAPADGDFFQELPGQLSWSAVADASGIDYYQVEFDGEVYNVSNTAMQLPSSLEAGEYSWRVRAVDNAGNTGGWSETAAFTIFINDEYKFQIIPNCVSLSKDLYVEFRYNRTIPEVWFQLYTLNGSKVAEFLSLNPGSARWLLLEEADPAFDLTMAVPAGVYLVKMMSGTELLGKPAKICVME